MTLQEAEIEILDNLEDGSEEEALPFEYSITSYGADFTIDSLVLRLERGDIYVPPFQRGFVWDFKKASRFIESLLLGLPVPGIFLSRDEDTQKLMVVDGQQRLSTLRFFYDGVFSDSGKEFALEGIDSHFLGATYKKLEDEDRRRIDDSILHATIIRQDEPSDGNSSIFLIFERLNTGGLQLQPQEIRASMFHGDFNNLLRTLNGNQQWRSLYGKVSSRMRDQELILRFLALFFNSDKYERPMKEFLNKYMGRNRRLDLHTDIEIHAAFEDTIDAIHRSLGPNAFKPRRALNAAVFDSVMVGVANRLRSGQISDDNSIRRRYDSLIRNDDFLSATETGTSGEEIVRRRLSLATEAFAGVK